jgi:hypothetical protein
MAYDPLLELLNCDVPRVQLPSRPGSSRQAPHKTGDFTLPDVLSKHVALDLQLRHVYHANIAEKAMQLLEKEVQDGNKEHFDLGGSEHLLDQTTMNWDCSLQRWFTRKSHKDDAGRFIEASGEKEVEFFGTQMIQIILLVAVRIAFLITESQGPLVEVFKAIPSASERVIPGTEEIFDLKELISLESSLLNPTAGTLRRIQRAKEAMTKLKFAQGYSNRNFVFTLVEWKFFLSVPVEIIEEIVHDAISQETTPGTTARTDFKWATCTGYICAEHAEHLAMAKLRFAKHTDDAQVTLEQFSLLDTPSSASWPSSNSSLPKESFHAAEHGASISNDGSRQKGKKRQAPGDDEFTTSKEAKKVALIQQVRSDDYLLIDYYLYLFEAVDSGALSRSNLFGGIDVELYNPRDTSQVQAIIASFIDPVCAPAKPIAPIGTACAGFVCVQ